MKKLIYLSIVLFAGLAACKKEAEITKMTTVSFVSEPTVSKSAVTLAKSNDTSSVVTFAWPAVKYPVKASVTYTLQIDVPADTVGNNAWANAKTVVVGKDVLSKSYLGKDLNTMALNLGLTPGAQGALVVRIQSYQDQYAYTRALTLKVTPYQPVAVYPLLYIPGNYQGWNPGEAPTAAALKPKIYEAYIYMPATDNYYYKFTTAQDWSHINYGDGGNGAVTGDGLAGGLVAPGPGYMQLSINLNTNTWLAVKTTWSILGDASPGGWDTDTQLAYDPAKKVWSVTCDMKKSGSFKFRANNEWKIDFGIDADGKLTYADSPVYGNVSGINNITVPSDGNYTLTLDLHDPSNYNYTIKKN
ncbi:MULTISPECIES: SusE domain-containing protein [unclassified Mucilaginibacter]|uniref:SusE domain-containing protein n=1 Tax=unclassified Mucilaginibacter TaxID=2617802 RepID=UPI002AC919D2|nr:MULTISPECIES: SusE domain-containing protein [unclassified Mucilaginibacter]MEB0248639.1 SusE domain-containing protein [Mucilaginibacter sp. 5B2]MEB0260115.1 SusE domain-containing protein [Mucilaginibacter sp. 10I4]MEB0279164.1 SusE domain-containing protein [Mucilaginibacter sp. 10B2]MEB0301579.1 SusE domain-containing protein [Mucilaginibacter sp. 5C4]WPX22342.1 SusE domain-containing protein [Mucilaginibacter sp. 5C4]